MNQEKSYAEMEAQAQAMINLITDQRNAALDQCANLMGTLAILEIRLKAVQMPITQEEKTNG